MKKNPEISEQVSLSDKDKQHIVSSKEQCDKSLPRVLARALNFITVIKIKFQTLITYYFPLLLIHSLFTLYYKQNTNKI